jgi:hypothetical protein
MQPKIENGLRSRNSDGKRGLQPVASKGSGGAGYGIFGNLVGLAFILLGVLGIISGFVDAYKQSTGEWKSYDE